MSDQTYFNWSSGKDSALAFYYMKEKLGIDISTTITSVNVSYERVSMHGLRKELLFRQVEELGLPLKLIELPENPSMEEYDQLLKGVVKDLVNTGHTQCGFGDIFLEDLRKYREEQLKPFGIECIFPLWKRDTKELIHEFIDLGFKAIVICTKAELLDESFVGRELDIDFINDLPENVDPCGENGEFHTFCFDGPIFKKPIAFEIGEKTYRTYPNPSEPGKEFGFWFCDLK